MVQLTKPLEIFVAIIIGVVVWFIASLIFSLIPILGPLLDLFVAPIIAGYVAGRLGGIWAAVILALAIPLLVWVVLTIIIVAVVTQIASLVGPILGLVGWTLEAIISIVVAIWGLFNLIFVGVGGWMGNAAREGTHRTINHSESSGQESPRFDFHDNLVRKRILGYILAYKRVELETLVSRYNLKESEIEEIIFEHLAEGKIRGTINPKKRMFILEV